jgi:hypothetical protein
MSRFNRHNFTTAELIGFGLGIVVIGFGMVALQAWVLGWVLGWFGVSLEFWKNVVIVILLNSIFGGTKASSS